MIQAGRKGAWIRVAVRSGWTMDILKVSSTGFPDGLVLGNVTLLTLSLFFCLKAQNWDGNSVWPEHYCLILNSLSAKTPKSF